MAHSHALPFVLTRNSEAMTGTAFSTTQETAHGLLRLEGERLVIQWRVARKTELMSVSEMKTDEEFEDVQEIVVPLDGVAGAVVRRRWWEFFRKPRIVLRASDLQAFEDLTGEDGLKLAHPAEIVLPVRRRDRLAAEEFAAELELAVAQRGLRAADDAARMRPASEGGGTKQVQAPRDQ